jgi:hypothetical protein
MKVKEKLHLKSTEALVIVFFFLLSLRVINWFQYPYIMASGDFRPPFNSEAFTKRVLYSWDEIDFGMPSVYSPRILDPFYFLMTVFQFVGLDLFAAELVTVFLMYFFSAILIYIFVKELTGDIVVSIVAAFFFVSNVYLINDREVTAIGFIDFGLAILPCLILFTKSIKTRSYKLMAISGMLCVFTHATFPNYRTTVICLFMLGLISLYFFFKNQLSVDRCRQGSGISFRLSVNTKLVSHYAKLLAVFGLAFLLGSVWVLALISSNFDILVTAYNEMSPPWFAGGLKIYDVTRLIARWGFYSGLLDTPYIPYRTVYLNIPWFVFLCFMPATLAFASLLLSKKHKTTIFFGLVAVTSLFLSSGFNFNDYGNQLYFALMDFFMLKAFREASNWIFFVVISFGILIGCTVSALHRGSKSNAFKMLSVGLVAALFLSTAYPLITGDVARNWLKPSIKGSYFPTSYAELNTMLSSQHWAVLMGERETYTLYNFTEAPFGCGNPYPLIFSKPVISGAGTEYIQSRNVELVNKIHQLMLTDQNIASDGKVSASSSEDIRYLPSNAVDGKWQTRWSSRKSAPQWLEMEWKGTRRISKITILFESAYAQDYRIETWNGTTWEIQLTIWNNTSTELSHSFTNPMNTTKLRLYFSKVTERFPSVSLWELEVYARTIGVPKFLGVLGIKQVIFEKDIVFGGTSHVDERTLSESEDFILAKDWKEVSLYNNTYALERLYVGDNIIDHVTLDEMCKVAEDSQWNILQHSVFINSTSTPQIQTNKTLTLPANFTWTERSPTSYEAHAESKGTFFLVLLESYDPNWRLYVNGSAIPEAAHLKVNAFANGWLIDSTGNLAIRVEYETQSLFTTSIAASIALPALLLVFLSRKEIRKIVYLIRDGFSRRVLGT